MTNQAWLVPAALIFLTFWSLARGRGILMAIARAPIGIGMPIFLLVLFISISQMGGMMTATLGGYDSAGRYNEAPWHQIALPVAVVLLGFQAWLWTCAALNAAAGRRDSSINPLPQGERWATRLIFVTSALLGVLPAYIVGGLTHLHADEVPWWSVILSLLLSPALWLLLRYRRSQVQPRRGPPLPRARLARLFICAPNGPWWAAAALAVAVAGIVVVEAAPGFVDRNLHTPTAVLLAAACYVPLATLWLTMLRELCCWILRLFGGFTPRYVASLAGSLLFLLTPLLGSRFAAQTGMYDVKPPGNYQPASVRTMASCFTVGCAAAANGPPIIVAIAGGASRSAAWSLSVMRMLDTVSRGAFSRQLFAVSGVSGGSLGAVTYAMARSQPGMEDTRSQAFLDATVELARYDLLPATAGRLFSFDLLTGLPTRGPALANAFEELWQRTAIFGRDKQPSFANVFTGDKWMPFIILNGVDVTTGKRLLTSNLQFPDTELLSDFPASRDLYTNFRASDAVLNSARFPIISPPGHIRLPGDKDDLHVIDGGTYEASGISTALDLAAKMPPEPKPILIIISNRGSDYKSPRDTICDTYDPLTWQQEQQQVAAANGRFEVPELLTSLVGLNATRNTRYLAVLADARKVFCEQRASGTGHGQSGKQDRVFEFDLPSPPTASPEAQDHGAKAVPVPMNWVLTAHDCAFILGEARRSTANWQNARRVAKRIMKGEVPMADEDLQNVLKGDPQACLPSPASRPTHS